MKTSLALFLSLSSLAWADVKLPAIFSDHAVLQRDVSVPVWGWAEPGEEVTVSLGTASKTTKADAAGKWWVHLDKLSAGDGLTMTVKGRNTLTVSDVAVGEVWLGSGQSNMAMTVNRALNFEQEKAAANFPKIRMFTVKSGPRKPRRMIARELGPYVRRRVWRGFRRRSISAGVNCTRSSAFRSG